jgi:hypothetical protein
MHFPLIATSPFFSLAGPMLVPTKIVRRGRRAGFVSRTVAAMLASLGLLIALIALLANRGGENPKGSSTQSPLRVYCAASNKGVMESVRAAYEREFAVPLQIQYGPSETLLASAEVSKSGDLYLPADDSYLVKARERGLIAERIPRQPAGYPPVRRSFPVRGAARAGEF